MCTALVLLLSTRGEASAQPLPTGPAPSAAAEQTSAENVLDEFATAWAGVSSYTATVTIFERKDAQTQNIELAYTFHKPTNVSVKVEGGPNAGVTMVWNGGTTVVAHKGSGFAALFKKTLPLSDPLATTIRGSSIDQLSFGAILAHAQQQAGALTVVPQSELVGQNVDAVMLTSADPAANAGLTREIVELSATSHLPVQVVGYAGTTLVRQVDFSNVVVTR